MQLICSFGWDLQLGDIKGAFMEAGPLEDKFRPLYASQPAGGIPGVPEDAVLEIVGNVYGQNDGPASWFRTFHTEASSAGWQQSIFDPCLYYLRSPNSNQLEGIMGVHVDDTAVGGSGPRFDEAIRHLKARFPYRKWRVGEGEFCGSYYRQNRTTKGIRMSQKLFAESLRPQTFQRVLIVKPSSTMVKSKSSEQSTEASIGWHHSPGQTWLPRQACHNKRFPIP